VNIVLLYFHHMPCDFGVPLSGSPYPVTKRIDGPEANLGSSALVRGQSPQNQFETRQGQIVRRLFPGQESCCHERWTVSASAERLPTENLLLCDYTVGEMLGRSRCSGRREDADIDQRAILHPRAIRALMTPNRCSTVSRR
jgi:hypothetical protein